MSVRMRSPYGTPVEVSEEKAVRLAHLGYKRVPEQTEPVVIEPKRRGRPRKVTNPEE